MADDIKPTRSVGQVLPTSRSRGPGQRKRPQQVPPKHPADSDARRPSDDDDKPHKVDEYA